MDGMSDRKNRDRGNKNANRWRKWECGCWHCISDKEKKRRIMDKQGRKNETPIQNNQGDI